MASDAAETAATHGPELMVTCEACETDGLAEQSPIVHVLYRSPEADATPYSWDQSTGGHPTNYSPRVEVKTACRVGPFSGARQALQLVFRNGRRNLHLQGGGWQRGAAREACVELELELTFEAEQGDAAAVACAL